MQRKRSYCCLSLVTRHLSLVTCLALAGCRAETASSPDEHHPAPVHIIKAEKMKLAEWTELLGVTQPLPTGSAKVTALVEGRVIDVLGDGAKSVAEGDMVAA